MTTNSHPCPMWRGQANNPLGVDARVRELELEELTLRPVFTIYCLATGKSLGFSELLFSHLYDEDAGACQVDLRGVFSSIGEV